jgi:Cof subfamily protein (haloacid dehalogenase superfamily)
VSIRLVLADVDGTLVTAKKALTERTIAAVRRLKEAGILFAITSGRPPRGMAMLIGPLDLTTPIAAFNGGVIADRDLKVIEQRVIPSELVGPIIEELSRHDLDVWLYRRADWFVLNPAGSHVDREARTVQFQPIVAESYHDLHSDVAKLVGVSDDHDAVTAGVAGVHDCFGDHVSVSASQPYYVDVTHPDANKGFVTQWLAAHYRLSTDEIATIGDMPNDVLMFAHSGLSIAMGNASPEVQKAARRVTTSNEDEGFAEAVERFILPQAAPVSAADR